jgi:tetratricopeptide (TPR) repeat protein
VAELEHLETLDTEVLEDLFSATKQSDLVEALRIIKLIANRVQEDGDYDSMLKWHQEIVNVATELQDVDTQARALFKSGFALFMLDRELDAVGMYQDAADLAASYGNDELLLDCLTSQVDCCDILEDWQSLIDIAEKAISIARILEDYSITGEMAINLANAYYRLESVSHPDVMEENHRIGFEYAEEALLNFENTGDILNIARANIEICDALIALNKFQEVLLRISESIDSLRENTLDSEGYKRVLARSLRIKGQALQNLGRHEDAIAELASGHELLDDKAAHGETLGILHWLKSECFQSLDNPESAMKEIQVAMKFAEKSSTYSLYYRCMDELVKILYANDREIEALFMSRGAMTEYESNQNSQMPSHVYFGFIIHASLSLHKMDRWDELLQVLDKVHNIRDYFAPEGRAIRIDALRAEALMKIERFDESLEILDSLLNFGELDLEDEDIGDSLLCRALIRFDTHKEESLKDFELGSSILKNMDLERKVTLFLEKNPQFLPN